MRDVSIEVRAGEVVGIAGLVGSGKSEVMRACFGMVPIAKGKVSLRGKDVTGANPRQMLDRGLFYLPPDRREEGLMMIRSSVENMTLPALHLGSSPAAFSWTGLRSGRPPPASRAT